MPPRSVDESVREIKRWAREPWAVAIRPSLPIDYPIDHPDMDPIWKAADEEGLVVVHHSFSVGYPGYRDLWQNPFLGRMASHPWGGMRFVASHVPGIDVPPQTVTRVEQAPDAEHECFEIAYELATHALAQPGVAGLHFISFRKDAGIAKLCTRLGIPGGRDSKERDSYGYSASRAV